MKTQKNFHMVMVFGSNMNFDKIYVYFDAGAFKGILVYNKFVYQSSDPLGGVDTIQIQFQVSILYHPYLRHSNRKLMKIHRGYGLTLSAILIEP